MSKTDLLKIFFCEFKLGRCAADIVRNINDVWSEGSVGESTIRAWFRKFLSGDFDLEDKDSRGCPSELNDDELKELVEADPRTVVRVLAEQLGINTGTISTY